MHSPRQAIDICYAGQIVNVIHIIESVQCIHTGIVHIHAAIDVHASDIIYAAHRIDICHGVHGIHVHIIDRCHIIDATQCIYTGHALCTVTQTIEQFLFAEIGDVMLGERLCCLP